MKTIQERRLEILDWEKDNRNSNNRSVKPNSVNSVACTYAGPIGCAVGRLIDDKELCSELDQKDDSSVMSKSLFNLLPEEVQDLGQEFLTDLQLLHDGAHYWNEEGLSLEGLSKYAYIEQRFCQ